MRPYTLTHTKTKKQKLQNKQDQNILLVRCSQPLSTKQTPHPTTKMERQQPPPHHGATTRPVASGPNSVPNPKAGHQDKPGGWCLRLLLRQINLHHRIAHYRRRHNLSQPHHPHPCEERGNMVLLRKEVIQPHLPVRLPCYDFVPIADPTFDGSLPKG